MCSYSLQPAHFTDANYHRRCGIHVQTLLLCHELVNLIVTVVAVSIGIVLLINPNLHRKTSLYKQFFEHYARFRATNYILFYRIAIASWIGVHVIHVITGIATVFATKLIKPVLLYPQLVMLLILVGFYIFSLICIITMNFVGSSIIWLTALITCCFCFFTMTNLYLLVLTHRYVADRREAIRKIMRNSKTVTFKDVKSPTKQ